MRNDLAFRSGGSRYAGLRRVRPQFRDTCRRFRLRLTAGMARLGKLGWCLFDHGTVASAEHDEKPGGAAILLPIDVAKAYGDHAQTRRRANRRRGRSWLILAARTQRSARSDKQIANHQRSNHACPSLPRDDPAGLHKQRRAAGQCRGGQRPISPRPAAAIVQPPACCRLPPSGERSAAASVSSR